MNRLGTITKIYNLYGVVRAQVVVLDEDSPEDVILLQPYGQNACPPVGSFVEIFINFNNSENKYAIPFNPKEAPVLKVGESVIYNHFGNTIYLKEDQEIDVTANKVNLSGDLDVAGNELIQGSLDVTSYINTDDVYKVDDIRVVTSRQPAILNPTGGAPTDVVCRVAVVNILNALRAHGLISP